jgi:hypothetical protein
MQYPIKFPKPFMEAMLAHFREREIPVGGKFDDPGPGSLGEFIQQPLATLLLADDLCILPSQCLVEPSACRLPEPRHWHTASMAVEPKLFLGRGSNSRERISHGRKRHSRRRRHTPQART